ncbi:PREDICTED: putative disease resistance protein RGA3 [Nelumbo nucifera]|uniref:Disease resistance protein RGA3 n=1 Tax=Nelumbo nucifera TaxID=4432 RepID=A0A1U8BKN0_NELNU|nr:PREDICTED: putative disease resistance protein RGA3 [Nelumbo nucifera]
MAEALVSSVVSSVKPLLQREAGLVFSARQELEKLSSAFSSIQANLNDAERKKVKEEAVRDWLQKLKDVAYDVDDLLDEWQTEVIRSTESWSRVPDFVKQVCGRDSDKECIKELLFCESSSRTDSSTFPVVIPIVGMGGLGKTTLAQEIYNDGKVVSHFQLRIWVHVSENFDVKRITEAIINDVTGDNCGGQLNRLQKELRKRVKNKRFLLVLDDVWNPDDDKWKKLKLPLKDCKQGSRILVTTRSKNTAAIMGTNTTSGSAYNLQPLSENHCLSLFKKIAFEGEEKKGHKEFEDIAEAIAKKCGGVPLAIKTVASLLKSKNKKTDWKHILNSEIWDFPEVEDGIFPALSLSYYDLPPLLKPCFSYLAIFPKDYEIEKDKLIKLWMANGYIRSDRQQKDMEIIGGEYFDSLLERSLLEAVQQDHDGNVVRCKMNDLVHKLAQFVAKGEFLIIEMGDQSHLKIDARHSSLLVRHQMEKFVQLQPVVSLRSLLFIVFSNMKVPHPPDLFDHTRSLRVMDLSHTKIEELPASLGKLKHIRYLDFSFTYIKELPESVGSLFNLQTLKLNECIYLCRLPQGMVQMCNLRHLELEGTEEINYLPKGLIEKLGVFATLSRFIVGSACKIGELKHLNLVRGKLRIEKLERVENREEAREAELKNKQYLDALVLCCTDKRDDGEWTAVDRKEVERMEGVFEGLRPHTNLKELEIFSYIGYEFPSWMKDSSFQNLTKVALYYCNKCKQLPALGRLPSLEELYIWRMEDLKIIGDEFYGDGDGGIKGFRRLKKLTFAFLRNWEVWDLGEDEMPSLLALIIMDCHKLKELPKVFPGGLSSLNISGCAELKSLSDGLRRLHSLKTLDIYGCVQLKDLPDLRPSTKLEELNIKDCPFLSSKNNNEGEEWLKIAHVRRICIEGKQLQKDGVWKEFSDRKRKNV